MTLDQLQTRFANYIASHTHHYSLGTLGPLVALTGGWASSLYTFSHQPYEPDTAPTTLVLKLYAPGPRGHEHALREWHALTSLRAVDYSVPRVILFEPDARHLGKPFIVIEYIPGKSFWHIFENADPAAQDRLIQFFAARLVALHALDPQLLEPAASSAYPYSFIEHELEHLRRDSLHSPHAILLETVQWLEERTYTVPCERPVILHRDYHPWNVLVDASERLWVIDWDWQIGDARFDLAWILTLMRRSGFHAFSSALQAEYAYQSGHSLDELFYFEVLTTVRWLLNVLLSVDTEEVLDDTTRAEFRAFLIEPVRQAEIVLQERTGIDVHIRM